MEGVRTIHPGLGCSLARGLFVLETLIRVFLESADVALYRGSEATILRSEAQDGRSITGTLWAERLDHMVLSLRSEGVGCTDIISYGAALEPGGPRHICAVR
jgi:hypothetical protein